jgi:hypothetical protein
MRGAMHAEPRSFEDALVADLVERVNRAGEGRAAREAYRDGFRRLRARLDLYPASRRASAVFESAAGTASPVAATCLPLGIALAMHLYPLCALQCIPLPLLSVARFQRAMLLRTIRSRALILANAGSERARGAQPCLVARYQADGVRVDGTCDYMSLASVADVVLFKARLDGGGGTVLCAADLRVDSVRVGEWRFSGTMRLSDTCSVTLAGHRIPHGRYVLVADDAALAGTADYQRCWFHLFLSELYLARLERLRQVWALPHSSDEIVSLNELAQLREYALRLLDDCSSGSDIQRLKKTTSAMKLRVSLMAQAAMEALRGREGLAPAEKERVQADASELGYIKWQPTADATILRALGVEPST